MLRQFAALVSQCFLPNQIIVSPSVHIFDIVSLFGAEFENPKIGISGKGKGLNGWYSWCQLSPNEIPVVEPLQALPIFDTLPAVSPLIDNHNC